MKKHTQRDTIVFDVRYAVVDVCWSVGRSGLFSAVDSFSSDSINIELYWLPFNTNAQKKREQERRCKPSRMWQMLQVHLSTQSKLISNLLEITVFYRTIPIRNESVAQTTIDTQRFVFCVYVVFALHAQLMLYLWYYQAHIDQLPHFQTCQTDKSNELKSDFIFISTHTQQITSFRADLSFIHSL